MNKRPLFWAVMCFALGEVLYIIAGKGDRISTTLVVLICLALIYTKAKVKRCRIIIYSLMLVAGFFRISWEEENYAYYRLYGRGEYIKEAREYGGYTVEHLVGKIYTDSAHSAEGQDMLKIYQNINAVGVVDDISRSESGYNVTLLLSYTVTDDEIIDNSYRIIIFGVSDEYELGTHIKVSGELSAFVPTGNPGEFNQVSYYKARGIVGYGFPATMSMIKGDGEPEMWYRLKSRLNKLKEFLDESLGSICDEESKVLYSGILLGDKGDICDEDMLLFRLSGIAHIFAISGLHIGIVGGLLYKLLRKIGIKFLPAAICSMSITILYGIMTGFSFSTIRAVVMLGLSLVGQVLGRRYDLLTGLGVALFVLLIEQPFRILDGGLLLSFGAVAGVAVSKYIVKLLENNKTFRRLQKKKTRWLYGIISALVFSGGISLVTVPLIAHTYFQIPTYSVLLNLIVVPLMSVTVFCGFFGALLGLVNQAFGSLVILPGAWSLKMYRWVCVAFQRLPFDVINTGKPVALDIIIYYALLLIVLVCLNPVYISRMRKWIHQNYKKWIPYFKMKMYAYAVIGVSVIIALSAIAVKALIVPNERIIFLDVGQGDGVLIKTESGTNMVIDLGSTTNDSLGKYVAYPALLSEGMSQVDYWFISHFDEDHISGLTYLIDLNVDTGIKIENIVISENTMGVEKEAFIKKAREKGINVIYMDKNDKLTGESFVIEAFHPGKEFDSVDKNERSLVLSYRTDKISILFTGDIGQAAISEMQKSGIIADDFDILKVPHHGSRYSYSMLFLEQVGADAAIISCGNRNFYGHPHQEMLEGLINAGYDIYRTDYMGAVRITIE